MSEKSPDRPAVAENPRTTRVRRIVLEAATELLIEEGHSAVTPHQVSKTTGIARSTIYRHWPDPDSLLIDAIDSMLAPDHTLSVVDHYLGLGTSLHPKGVVKNRGVVNRSGKAVPHGDSLPSLYPQVFLAADHGEQLLLFNNLS